MSNTWFQFKQFLITQERSALKVGTDGVLLGAWCGGGGDGLTGRRGDLGPGRMGDGEWNKEHGEWNKEHGKGNKEHRERRGEEEVTGGQGQGEFSAMRSRKILDVGTGTGLIALMLAQRTKAHVTAIEINEEASADAMNNFSQSPWNDRLELHHMDFNEYCRSAPVKYDLIVSNPPYFKQSLKSADHAASLARHDVTLSFEQLIGGAKKLLNVDGRFAVILPFEALDDFRETARLAGFYLARKTSVIPKVGKAPKRVLLEFSAEPLYPLSDELIILMEDGGYSDQFVKLTNEFYLNGS